jgi:hypothetical protein
LQRGVSCSSCSAASLAARRLLQLLQRGVLPHVQIMPRPALVVYQHTRVSHAHRKPGLRLEVNAGEPRTNRTRLEARL